jgi:type IV pilus assembly protein PilW
MNQACRTKTVRSRLQRGLSMIEMMVGITIGMITVVVIFQVLTASDARTRSTAAGGDAQMSGTVAMYSLDRDIKLGGMGFGTGTAVYTGCSVAAHNSDLATPDFTFALMPVQIVQGADGSPDAINVLYSNSQYFVAAQGLDASTATTKRLRARAGFQLGDLIIVAGRTSSASPVSCALLEVTVNNNPDNLTIGHTQAPYARFYPNKLNPSDTSRTPTFNTSAGFGASLTEGTVFNLGPEPQRTEWRIAADGMHLTQRNSLLSDAVIEVAAGVVNLKAQYGVDGANGEPVDNIINDNEWTNTAPTDVTRLRAVRVALLVRSDNFEVPMTDSSGNPVHITPAAPTWAGGTFGMNNLDGTAGGTAPDAPPKDWRNYRYRVYESVIPLRNMIWGTAP